MHYWPDIIFGLVILALVLLTQFVLLPYLRVQAKRRESMSHRPQPEEIWVQNDGIIYIDAVTSMGVEIMAYDPNGKTFFKWRDSWEQWNQRLKTHTLYYSGQRRPLGGS